MLMKLELIDRISHLLSHRVRDNLLLLQTHSCCEVKQKIASFF